ncbi:glycosyltransferase family protein [Desulfonatronum parangueonense]
MKHDGGLRTLVAPIALAVLAAVFSYGIATLVFQRATLNADENSYVFQAYNFLDGVVARPSPPYPEAFHHEMIITSPEVGWLSRYPFAHSLFLAPGVLIGDPYLVVALAAGLTVFVIFLSGRMLLDPSTGIIAAILLLFSPFFLFYSGTLLSHSSALLAASGMLYAYIYWRKHGDIRFAFLSGLCWAFLFNNRTYTALLMAMPFAVDSLWHLYRERTWRMLKATSCFALASGTGVILLLAYNYLSTGDLWTMTYLKYTDTQRLGFGIRHFGRIDHSFLRGVEVLFTNLTLLNTWLWGFAGSLILWVGLTVFGWRKQWTPLFVGTILSVCLGYIYFWYAGPRDAGPSYYFELLPFFVLSAAFGVQKMLTHVRTRHVVVVMAVWLVFNAVFTLDAAKGFYERNAPRRDFLDALEHAPRPSLIFISKAEHHEAFKDGNDMVFNPRGLKEDIVVARWNEHSNQALMRRFEDRVSLKFAMSNGMFSFMPMPERMNIESPMGGFYRFTGTDVSDSNIRGGLLRVAREGEHVQGFLAFGSYYHLYPGRFAVEFDIKANSGHGDSPAMLLEVVHDSGRETIASRKVGFGEEWRVERFEFDVDEFITAEPRVFFYGNGEVQVAAVRVMEIQ